MTKTAVRYVLGTVFAVVACGAQAVLPPSYLSVPEFQRCLSTQKSGAARTWCMPSRKPMHCPAASWTQLKEPADNVPVPHCAAKKKQKR